jgi:hypothetical protein
MTSDNAATPGDGGTTGKAESLPSHLAVSHSGTDLFDQETGDSFRGVVNQMMRQHYTPPAANR